MASSSAWLPLPDHFLCRAEWAPSDGRAEAAVPAQVLVPRWLRVYRHWYGQHKVGSLPTPWKMVPALSPRFRTGIWCIGLRFCTAPTDRWPLPCTRQPLQIFSVAEVSVQDGRLPQGGESL